MDTTRPMGPAHPMFKKIGRTVIAEGKTKRIVNKLGDSTRVIILAKDDITAGDGAKHDIIPNKGRIATQTTCNVFQLLKDCKIPVAFDEQCASDSFIAPNCKMLPYEVVTRREAHGSFLKRNPHLKKGHVFQKIVVEFFLKTNDRKWKNHDLICDDPYMILDFESETISLFNPAKPFAGQEPFLVLETDEVFIRPEEISLFAQMTYYAHKTFLVLEKAWQIEGRKLVDMKVEFGIDHAGKLLLADVIDNDSWRVLEDGAYIDKQVYRDGGDLSNVAKNYLHVEQLTSRFKLPQQRVIVWTGSPVDDVQSLLKNIEETSGLAVSWKNVVCSMHKEPVRAITELAQLVQEVPDTVVIAVVGMSNGAGPTLSAATNVPVITVPGSFEKFPDDVWSSLRTPSNVPVLTVLNQTNAVLSALGILALHNPMLYAELRYRLEKRLNNFVIITSE